MRIKFRHIVPVKELFITGGNPLIFIHIQTAIGGIVSYRCSIGAHCIAESPHSRTCIHLLHIPFICLVIPCKRTIPQGSVIEGGEIAQGT